MFWFAYNYTDFVGASSVFWILNGIFFFKHIESSLRRTALFSFDYRIADKVVSSTFLSITQSFYNFGAVLPEGLFPMTLDSWDFMSQGIFGCVYCVVFFAIVGRTLIGFQQKDVSE
jgi:hypothetical protein